MSSLVKIFVHAVWSTKFRQPLLNDMIRHEVFQHIFDEAEKGDVVIDRINGYFDHVHCVILLGKCQTISDVIKGIKGESSFWINRNKLSKTKFQWQDDYWAVSVSKSHLEAVRKYIDNQEKHHGKQKQTFERELEELIRRSGMEKGSSTDS